MHDGIEYASAARMDEWTSDDELDADVSDEDGTEGDEEDEEESEDDMGADDSDDDM